MGKQAASGWQLAAEAGALLKHAAQLPQAVRASLQLALHCILSMPGRRSDWRHSGWRCSSSRTSAPGRQVALASTNVADVSARLEVCGYEGLAVGCVCLYGLHVGGAAQRLAAQRLAVQQQQQDKLMIRIIISLSKNNFSSYYYSSYSSPFAWPGAELHVWS